MPLPHPPILSPKIDKISVAVAILDKELQKQIEQYLWDAMKSGDGIFQPGTKKGYRTAARLHPDKLCKEHVLIQAGPKKPGAAFIRLEWNPNKLGAHNWHSVCELLATMLPKGYDDVLAYGRVTRLDVAFDIIGHHADRLIVRAKQMKTFQSWFNNATGTLQTGYFGTSKSDQITVYNRTAGDAKCSPPITRFEFRLKPNIALSLLGKIPNPLRRLDIIDGAVIDALFPPGASDLFKDSCRVRGFKKAYASASLAFGNLLSFESKGWIAPWWDPDVLWSHWPDVLDRYRLLLTEAEEADAAKLEIYAQKFAINCNSAPPALAA